MLKSIGASVDLETLNAAISGMKIYSVFQQEKGIVLNLTGRPDSKHLAVNIKPDEKEGVVCYIYAL